jgi:hypothetical protein
MFKKFTWIIHPGLILLIFVLALPTYSAAPKNPGVISGRSHSPKNLLADFNPGLPAPATLENQPLLVRVSTRTISGTITGLAPGNTVRISYGTGKKMRAISIGAGGNFITPALPANLPCVLIPQSTRYRFVPAKISVPPGSDDVTGLTFAATPQVILRGTITVNGKPIRDVVILAGGYSTKSNARGAYQLMVPDGDTVTPIATHSLLTFSPGTSARPSSDFTQDWTTATVLVTGRIQEASGNASLTGVTVSAGSSSAVTGADGAFSLTVTSSDVKNLLSFSVTPQPVTGYRFIPASQIVNPKVGAQAKNFSAVRLTFTIKGRVTDNGVGIGGVLINAGNLRAVTDKNGIYMLKNVPFNTPVQVTANKYGYTFSTAAPFIMGAGDVSGIDLTATPTPVLGRSISGTITIDSGSQFLKGVLVNLFFNNRSVFTTRTDPSGHYSFSNLVPASGYVVQPVATNYTFRPDGPSSISLETSDAIQNFQAAHYVTVSGTLIGLPLGTPVSLVLSGSKGHKQIITNTVDTSRRYIFSQVADDSYTLTLSADGYLFTPETGTFTVDSTTRGIVQNFTAGPVFSITGHVTNTDGTTPLQGAVVSAGGSTTNTDETGAYVIKGLEKGTYSISVGYPGKSFEPQLVTLTTQNLTGIDFTAH